MEKPMISVENLYLSFDDTLILNNLEYLFYNANIYTILGINGSGKTSFLKCIVGMLKYNSGNIDLYKDSTISFVPDSSYLYEYLTGIEYLYFVGKLNDMNKNEVIERSESLLKELYLYNSRNILIKNYSNGMKQKLSLASSMLTQPNIICIDEPLTGTDYASNKVIKNFLKNYSKQNLVILTTHFLDLAYELSTEVLILKDQKISGKLVPESISFEQFENTVESRLFDEQ